MQFRILRTPKFYMIIFLLILTLLGIIKYGVNKTLPQILIAIVIGILLDLAINYFKDKRVIFPSSAIITGLLIATGLSTGTELYIPAILTAIAVISKHTIKINNRHIFNPANFGLLFGIVIIGSGVQWWASDVLWLLIPLGLFLTYKVKRHFIIISYLITNLALSIIL